MPKIVHQPPAPSEDELLDEALCDAHVIRDRPQDRHGAHAERGGALLVAIADRREGRGEDDALHTRIARRAQHPQRALTRGNDQVVFMLGRRCRKGRCDMQHVIAAGGSLGPAGVLLKVGREEG